MPVLGSIMNLFLIATCPRSSIERLFIWMAIGLVIYGLYGRKYSKANNNNNENGNEKAIELFEQRKNEDDTVSV